MIPVFRLDNSIDYVRDKEKTARLAQEHPRKGASAGSLREAIDYALNREKTEEILRYLEKELRDLGCRVIRPEPPVTPVLSFTIPGWHPGEAGDILSGSYDIICRTGLHCSPRIMENLGTPQGTIRLSLSRFTKRADADRVLEAVAAMCGDQIEET